MADNKYKQLTVQDYLDENGKYQEIEKNLNNDLMGALLDGDVTDSDLRYITTVPESELDSDEIYALAAKQSELDDTTETAQSRYLSQIQIVKDNHSKLKDADETLDEAEDAAEGRTHIIFDTLDMLNRPMMAVEGIFQGMFSWRDELYEGEGLIERAIDGFQQGLRAQEDKDGNRIITEASLVHALITGEHEHDWSGIESLMIGLPVMFLFGRWDPVMSVFSTLSESKYTAASVFTSLKEKGIFGRLFEDEVFDMAFEDSVFEMIKGAGSLKTSQTRSLWKKMTEKLGLSNVIIKDSANPQLGEINLTEFTKDLARSKMDMVNNKDILSNQYLGAIKDVDIKINTAIENAIVNGDTQVLNEIGAFNLAKEFLGGDEAVTVRKIQEMANFGSQKYDFRQKLVQQVKADMYDKLLRNNKTFITMNEIVKDLIDSKSSSQAVNMFTQNQILEVYQAFLASGMWDVETLLKYIDEPLKNHNLSIGIDGKFSEYLSDKKRKRGAAKRRLSLSFKEGQEEFGIPQELLKTFEYDKAGNVKNFDDVKEQISDWDRLIEKDLSKEEKKQFKIFKKKVEDELDNYQILEDDINKTLKQSEDLGSEKLNEARTKFLERASAILKGDITFSELDDELAAIDVYLTDAEGRLKREKTLETKHQKKQEKLQKELDALNLELGKLAPHLYEGSLDKNFKTYRNLQDKKSKLLSDLEANEGLHNLNLLTLDVRNFFNQPKKRVIGFDRNNPDAFVSYLSDTDFVNVLDTHFDVSTKEGKKQQKDFLKWISKRSENNLDFSLEDVYNGKASLPEGDKIFKKIDKYNKEANNPKSKISTAKLETLQEQANRVQEGNKAAKEKLKEIINGYKIAEPEIVGDIENLRDELEKTEKKIFEMIQKLNNGMENHKMKLGNLSSEERKELDTLISKIRIKKKTIETMSDRKGSGGLYRDFAKNQELWEKRIKGLKNERENILELKEKETFDRQEAKDRIVSVGEDGKQEFTGNYSLAAMAELRPIFEEIINIDNITDYSHDLGKASEIIEDKVDGYMFSLNKNSEIGRDFANVLDSMTKGKLDDTLIDEFSKVPFINNRAFENLGQAIQLGTEGRDYVSPILANILEQLGGIQETINENVFSTMFKNLSAGPEMKKAIMQSLTRHQDAFSGEIMDYITDYQKKIAINRIDKYDASGNIVDETGKAPETNTSNIATGGTSSIKSPSVRGKVSDINEAYGYKKYGANYSKYDMTQKMYLEDPLVAINQQAKDMVALGDMLITLHHAAETGAILVGTQAPAKLVYQGLYKEVNADQFKGAITNILKLENERYVSNKTKNAIRRRKQQLEQGRPVFHSEDKLVNDIRTEGKVTDGNADKYASDFLNRHFADVLRATGNDKIYLPTYMFNMLKVEPPKELNSFLQLYDRFMNVWKSWTLLSPGFNFKNFAGNLASQYTVDRKGFSFIGSTNKLAEGIEINRQLVKYEEKIRDLQAEAFRLNIRDFDDVETFVKKGLKDDVEFEDIAGYSAEDVYSVMKDARNARVLPQSIQEAIGLQTNKGVASVAYTPKDVVEAYKATHRVDAIQETNPIMSSFLQGHELDLKKPEGWAQKLLSWNLNLSHEMTNGAKLAETLRLKKLEQEWASKFFKNGKLKDKSFGEFDEFLNGLDTKQRKEWRLHKRDRYRQDFGFENRTQMLQDMFFDPGALFGAEKHIVSRLMPFWGFWKKSMQLSLSRLNKLDVQGMYGIERALDYVMRAQDIDYADMSEFSRNSQYLPIKIGDNRLIEVKWGNPTNTLNNLLVRDKNLLAELYSNANPVLKFAASEVANREDLFFGGKYDSLLDEAANTLAPGSVRNLWRFLKTEQQQAGYGPDFSDDYKKSALTIMMPSIFKNEVISDNQAAAYNAAALILEKELKTLRYDEGYQIDEELEFPEIPDYQDYIWDFF